MDIRNLQSNDIEFLIEFNRKVFHTKKIGIPEYIKFWLSKNNDECQRSLVIVDDKGDIVGQNFFSSMSYYFNNEEIESVWGFDLIVDEKYREQNWGVDLLLACKKAEPKSFATGSGPDALKMNLKLGQKLLGWIKKYVGVINPLWFCTAFRGIIPINNFPKELSVKHSQFNLICDKSLLPDIIKSYNNNLLEFTRDKDYLSWRYFNDLHEYAFYYNPADNVWFVVRTTVIKHITVLLLVDWRCDANDKEAFESIYKACKSIANIIHIPVIITGSSLKTFDEVLESHHFKSIGRARPVIGRIKITGYESAIEERNFIFATLGDSDGETNWK